MASALAVASLQNVEAAFLNRELEVLHIFEVTFEDAAHFHQLFVRGGHFLGQISNGMRRAYACDDVFALSVDQVFAVELLLAGGRIARERDARAAIVTHVAEDHRADIRGRAPVVRIPILPAIDDGAFIVPGPEHGRDRAPHLFVRVLGYEVPVS